MEQARQIREAAKTEASRKQVAMEAYADALEIVPRVLAENAGHDPLKTLVDLRSAHANGDAAAGVDVTKGGILDAFEHGVVDLPSVKINAITNATEATNIVTHIDDVVTAKSLSNGQ
jgi:chaperonin GroEL (HSP60 family)